MVRTTLRLRQDLRRDLRRRAAVEEKTEQEMFNAALEEYLRGSREIERKKSDFSRFCGMWSNEEYEEFEKNTAEFEAMDEE